MMSSNFILSLRSFNSGQYLAMTGDDVVTTLLSLIHSHFLTLQK